MGISLFFVVPWRTHRQGSRPSLSLTMRVYISQQTNYTISLAEFGPVLRTSVSPYLTALTWPCCVPRPWINILTSGVGLSVSFAYYLWYKLLTIITFIHYPYLNHPIPMTWIAWVISRLQELYFTDGDIDIVVCLSMNVIFSLEIRVVFIGRWLHVYVTTIT